MLLNSNEYPLNWFCNGIIKWLVFNPQKTIGLLLVIPLTILIWHGVSAGVVTHNGKPVLILCILLPVLVWALCWVLPLMGFFSCSDFGDNYLDKYYTFSYNNCVSKIAGLTLYQKKFLGEHLQIASNKIKQKDPIEEFLNTPIP